MENETYIELLLRELRRTKALAEGAIAQISTEQFFAVLAPGDNSIAVIVKHVAGNLISRWTDFLSADGEKPGRDRDAEFCILATDTREHLIGQWEAGWGALFEALVPLRDSDLQRIVTIRREQLTVLQAINRQLTHYSYHVGQIVFVAKHQAGASWKSLSIPLGASAKFNQDPIQYLGKPEKRA